MNQGWPEGRAWLVDFLRRESRVDIHFCHTIGLCIYNPRGKF